jgi:hypothetical protein
VASALAGQVISSVRIIKSCITNSQGKIFGTISELEPLLEK